MKVCFGKKPARHDGRTLRFGKYSQALAAPPTAYSLLDAYPTLRAKLPEWFPMDGNDQLEDCTFAARAHAITVFSVMVGRPKVPGAGTFGPAVGDAYLAFTGGQDTGCAELDVLNDWRKNALWGDLLEGYVAVDPKNHLHVQQAIQMFGGLYLGFMCQENLLQEFDAGQNWTPGPLTEDGHAVYAVGYDATGVEVLTWGSKETGTWAWWDECVDEAYALLPSAAELPHFNSAFDFAQLRADLALVAG